MGVAIMVLGSSVFLFWMVMSLTLHPIESIYLKSFVLLEHLTMLLSSTLVINC